MLPLSISGMRRAGCVRAASALFLLVVSATRAAQAQEPASPQLPAQLSLEDALRYFRKYGLDLIIAEAAVTSAQGDLRVAGQVSNPNLSYSFSHIFNYDPNQVCPPVGTGKGGEASCSPNVHSITLSDNAAIQSILAGKRGLRKSVAEAALKAAKLARIDAKRNLEFQVKSQYMQAVLMRDQLDFALEVQKGWRKTYDLVHLRYQKGAISEADEAKVETAMLEADQAVALARQALSAAKAGLAFLLGVRAAAPDFDVAPDLPHFAVPASLASATPAVLLEQAIESRPDLRAQRAQEERAEAGVRLARRLRFPDLALQAGFNYAAPGGGSYSSNTTPPTLLFGVSGNLPVFYLSQGEILKGEADLRTQTVTLAKTKAQILADVTTAYGNYATTRELVERMEGRLLERAERARNLVEIQYQKGAASLLEYLDAQRTYIATRIEYHQDLANYWTAVFQVEQAVGAEFR
jgi:cobalt-zinc-cadmium efflux system outer membrane protein